MKSKRAREAAATATVEDHKPIAAPVSDEQPAKKRKRNDDDAEPSTEVKKSKKDKKKDKKEKETRKEKKDKRKNLQDLPEQDMDVDEAELAAENPSKPESESKKKEGQKETKAEGQKEVNGDDKEAKKLERRQNKKEKKALKQANKATNAPAPTTTDNKSTPQEADDKNAFGGDAIDLDASSANKPGRNIVFVGNLPYSATAASISAHFVSLKPIAVRCLTKKDDPKACRGIAFVEFASPQHQRTCLDKFHHSMFDDGVSPARKINVELTAGGGGKNKNRQEKIKEKNKKLDENRAKRIEKEKAAKEENQTNNTTKQSARMEDSIHPSRLARLPGLGQ